MKEALEQVVELFRAPVSMMTAAAAQFTPTSKSWMQGFLSDRIKNNWLSTIAPLEPRDCAATCLFAFRMDE
jgi:hypothetical protein